MRRGQVVAGVDLRDLGSGDMLEAIYRRRDRLRVRAMHRIAAAASRARTGAEAEPAPAAHGPVIA